MIFNTVLSLFDGMSCSQIALNRVGIKYNNFYASEIDKHAIKVTQHNYPNTIQLGSVVDIDGYSLPKIDFLCGGSPCQSFSFAGKQKGMSTKCETEILTLDHYLELKQQGYEFEGQSYLFWEYMRLLNETKPKYFLLENVLMSKKWETILTRAIGVEPIMINSALVSAQSRKRLYWTNIGLEPSGLFGDLESTIQQPKDKGILLKDILEENVGEKYYLSDKVQERLELCSMGKGIIGSIKPDFRSIGQKDLVYGVENKMGALMATDYKQPKQIMCISSNQANATTTINKSSPMVASMGMGGGHVPMIVAMRGRGENNDQQLEQRKDDKTNCLTSVQKDNLGIQLNQSTESGGKQPYQHNRVYDVNGISPCLNVDKRSPIVVTHNLQPRSADRPSLKKNKNAGDSGHLQKYDGKSYCLDTGNTQAVEVICGDYRQDEGFRWRKDNKTPTLTCRQDESASPVVIVQPKIYDDYNQRMRADDKTCTLTPNTGSSAERNGQKLINENRIRRLTPIECEKLQTVPVNYTNVVSDSQRYKMIGNGWTIDVIAHILKYIK